MPSASINKKVKHFVKGVEITETLDFKNWQPGFEYTKNIKLKNLNTKTVRITYEIPKSRFFTTLYPKQLNLSPGTTFNLPITFRPLEKVYYEDEINFYFQEFQHYFTVFIYGLLPEYKLDFIKSLDFGMCNAFENAVKDVLLKNPTDLDTSFEWDVKAPFNISPLCGEIKAKETLTLQFSTYSSSAAVYKGTAICKFGANLSELYSYETIELNAIGKYPHILVESETQTRCNDISLNFENTPFGKTTTKYFNVINMTPVKTSFFIERIKSIPQFDMCFKCQQESGVLQPYEKQKIPISYSPNVPVQEIYDYFNVYSSGKLSKASITCYGTSKPSKCLIEPKVLNFGQFDIRQTSSRAFEIKNFSDSEVAFQFDVDCTQSSFLLSCTNGRLKSGETKLIQIILKPQFSIIYYKKLVCLIENHDILYIELFGTCHSETIKPALLEFNNLKNYHKLYLNGLTINPPEQLQEMYLDGNLSKILMKNDDNEQDKLTVYEEFFLTESKDEDDTNESKIKKHVTIDNQYVDFGSVSNFKLNEEILQQKSINIFNNTKGKLLICWNKSDDDKTFSISPLNAEIPPLKSYSFRVIFKPNRPSQFYDSTLEGYALYKSLCDYTVVNQKFVMPSWCLNIKCSAHTFHPSEEHFPPRYTVDTENLVFPISVVNQPVYKSLTIKNTAETYPLVFNIDPKLFNKWQMKPYKGLIKPKEHQILIFKFTPDQESHLYEKCEIKLNEMEKHLLELLLISTAEIARVELANDGFLYFKPTCKGNITKREYEIINKTRMPINYEWKLPYESKNLFTPLELTGSLKPYESKQTQWIFTPKKFEKFNIKARLLAWIDEHRNKSECYNLRLLGSCTTGGLQALENYKDFGCIVVGGSATSEIVLINNNDCALDFELDVKQTVDDNSANKYKNDPCILELELLNGSIEARSKKIISCRIRPARVINYQFTIEYKIIYPNDEDDLPLNETSSKEVLCQLIANGVFPKIAVSDIKAIGSASNLSKDYLWRLFSVDTLNSSMNCEPNAEELIYSIATRQDTNRRITNKPKVIIDFNFNAAPVNTNDTEIALFFENNGVVTTEWSILFPRDLQIELEYWTESGEYDEEELEEMKIQDNKLFTISPKRGVLEPGEVVRVQLSYKHAMIGQNKLPVLLKLAKGREIMINLSGVTVPNHSPYVYFPTNKYQFLPVEIGLLDYPIQIFELYNGGDKPARVEIDTSQLSNLAVQNYSHNILECLTDDEIIIPPGTSFPTKWKFSPLESKTYHIDVIFKSDNNETNIVTFTGIGYDARRLKNFTIKSLEHEDIPNKQLFILPNQMASLSVDRIVFGDVPLFSKERKILFVKNNSNEHQISFNWHVTTPEHVKFIRIQPSRGVIGVGQSKMCKLTFLAKTVPSFYNIDLICEIKNESEIDKYNKDLQAWENEQKRQWSEFEIDDTELEKRLITSAKNDLQSSIESNLMKPPSQLSLHNFKTIPPILANNYLNESSISRVRRLRKEKKMWKKPIPPTPFVLHLNVISRTQYLSDYLQTTNEKSSKFIDGLLGSVAEMTQSSVNEFSPESLANSVTTLNEIVKKPAIVTDDEVETLAFILTDVLRSLITDKNFHLCVQSIKDEPIPYFLQYSQKRIGGFRKYLQSELDHHNHDESMKRKRSVTIDPSSKNKNSNNFTTNDATSRSKLLEKSEIIDTSFKIVENEAENNLDETTNVEVLNENEIFDISQKLKISPIFGSFIENILENTLANILTEAFNNEFNITTRPRLIALPPRSIQNPSTVSNNTSEHDQHQTHSQLKLKTVDLTSNSSPDLTIRSGTNTAQK